MTFRQTALTVALSVTLMFCGSAAFADSHEGAAPEPKRVKHPSGLIVVVIEPGTGAPIKKGQTAVVHYTGWLDAGDWKKGEKFDSSLDRGKPFPVRNVGSGRVIQGWNDGIAPHGSLSGMRVGEKRQLLIPAKLGYGSRGAGAKIPPNARLIFDVEMLEIR
jgi:FKBP-type peptidyl-prolyl cis-trans isomerase